MKTLICAIIFFMLSGMPALASTVDDVIMLSKNDINEDVLLALTEKDKANFVVRAADILKLKEAKASDKVIVALIKHKGVEEVVETKKPKADEAKKPAPDTQPEIIVIKREVVEAPVIYDPAYVYPYAYPYCSSPVFLGGCYGRPGFKFGLRF